MSKRSGKASVSNERSWWPQCTEVELEAAKEGDSASTCLAVMERLLSGACVTSLHPHSVSRKDGLLQPHFSGGKTEA